MEFYHQFRFPVHIRWDFEDFFSNDIERVGEANTEPKGFLQVFKHPARILSIVILAEQAETIRTLITKMNRGPAPLLTSLTLSTRSEILGGDHVSALESLRLPALRALSLRKVAVPWRADWMRATHLRHLELRYSELEKESDSSQAQPSLSAVLVMLASLTNLEVLSWAWALPRLAPGSPLRVVPMPHLRELALEGPAKACVDIMQHLSPAQSILVDLDCVGGDDDDAVAADLWDAAARYWVPNTSAPPNVEVAVLGVGFRIRIAGRAAGGNDQKLCFKFRQDRNTVKHAVLRALGPHIPRVQTPARLVLDLEQCEIERALLRSFVRSLSGLAPGLSIRGIIALKYFVDVFQQGGDRDEGGAVFDCPSDLSIEKSAQWRWSNSREKKKRLERTIAQLGRLCSALEKRQASGIMTPQLLTVACHSGLSDETVKQLLSTYDGHLQIRYSY
jgi:hypothetical protein